MCVLPVKIRVTFICISIRVCLSFQRAESIHRVLCRFFERVSRCRSPNGPALMQNDAVTLCKSGTRSAWVSAQPWPFHGLWLSRAHATALFCVVDLDLAHQQRAYIITCVYYISRVQWMQKFQLTSAHWWKALLACSCIAIARRCCTDWTVTGALPDNGCIKCTPCLLGRNGGSWAFNQDGHWPRLHWWTKCAHSSK